MHTFLVHALLWLGSLWIILLICLYFRKYKPVKLIRNYRGEVWSTIKLVEKGRIGWNSCKVGNSKNEYYYIIYSETMR